MRDIFQPLVALPTPVLLMILAGLLMRRRSRWGRRLLVFGAVLLLLVSVPATGKIAAIPLLRAVPALDDATGDENGAARMPGHMPVHMIVVPTAGIYDDESGGWWAGAESVRRAVAGLEVQAAFDVPLALVGGVTTPGAPPEAEVVARVAGLAGDDVILETRAANSWQTGQMVARLLAETPRPSVALVTSALHMARMAASLRHAGIEVLGVPVGQIYLKFEGWKDGVPGYRGLDLTRRTIHEYVAIVWYLATGRLAISDVFPPRARDADKAAEARN